MRRALTLVILGGVVCAGVARGDGVAETGPPAQGAGEAAAAQDAAAAKLLGAVQQALERNAQEIKALKEQYARDMEEQRKKVEAQQKLLELQRKQIGVLEQQAKLLAGQVQKQGPAVETIQAQGATLEARAKQAARRDRELAEDRDALIDSIDARLRSLPRVPNPLSQFFLPSGTNTTPLAIWNTLATLYNDFPNRRGAGTVQFQEFTPFFFVQLNNRFLLSAETSFTQSGVSLGQAQIDAFVNDRLTASVGYFLSPIGFWSERLDPRWINKLPDVPLVMRQVIPDGLTTTGLMLRGARYLFRSPVKFEYAVAATNGLGVPGNGTAADFADLGGLIGTTGGINDAAAYCARVALWLPARGINFGVSELVNVPYSRMAGPNVHVFDPYFNYHRGNWDVRFEYGDNRERTAPFIGNNMSRTGLYAQVAYRNYASLHKHLQRLEYVFRFSDSYFHGVNLSPATLASFSPRINAPVDRNQYTIGINYYFYATAFLKVAYEFNDEIHKPLADNVFMAQFVTNF